MVNHILLNSVFFKNLSPLASTDVIRDFLSPHISDSSEILRIDFRCFPGSTQRYVQVDFKTSAGVTAATSLNGQSLLGVPIVATVIDPVTTGNAAGGNIPMSLPSITPGYITTAPMNAARPAPSLLGNIPDMLYREPEIQQLGRTIHVACIPDGWDLDRLLVLLSAHVKQLERMALVVTDRKMLDAPERIALIEFKTSEMASATKRLPAFARFIDGKEMIISQAKTTVSPRDPDNVSFELPPSVPVPVAYQQLNKLKLQEKVARARALAQSIPSLNPGSDRAKSQTSPIGPLPTNTGSHVPASVQPAGASPPKNNLYRPRRSPPRRRPSPIRPRWTQRRSSLSPDLREQLRKHQDRSRSRNRSRRHRSPVSRTRGRALSFSYDSDEERRQKKRADSRDDRKKNSSYSGREKHSDTVRVSSPPRRSRRSERPHSESRRKPQHHSRSPKDRAGEDSPDSSHKSRKMKSRRHHHHHHHHLSRSRARSPSVASSSSSKSSTARRQRRKKKPSRSPETVRKRSRGDDRSRQRSPHLEDSREPQKKKPDEAASEATESTYRKGGSAPQGVLIGTEDDRHSHRSVERKKGDSLDQGGEAAFASKEESFEDVNARMKELKEELRKKFKRAGTTP